MTLRKMKEGNANFPLSISATEMDPFSLHHPQSVRTHDDRDIEMFQFQFLLDPNPLWESPQKPDDLSLS